MPAEIACVLLAEAFCVLLIGWVAARSHARETRRFDARAAAKAGGDGPAAVSLNQVDETRF